jgi:hypothetical protein
MWWLGIRSSAEFPALNGAGHPGYDSRRSFEESGIPKGDDAVAGLAVPKWSGLGNAAK